MGRERSLLPLVQRYMERDPATAADLLETLDEAQAVAVLKALPTSLCAQVVPHLHAVHAAALLGGVPPELFENIVKRMRPEQAAGLLTQLPEERRRTLLDHLTPPAKRRIQDLLTYPENSAGRLMTTDCLVLRENQRVKEAISRIRTLAGRGNPTSYAYVVDGEDRLLGVLNMRDLLLATGETRLAQIVRADVFTVDGFTERERVAQELAARRYFAAPVVDAERRLLGIVYADQLIGDAAQEASQDILKMVGVPEDERTFSPTLVSLRKRLPWLYVNLGTAFLAAGVVALFEDIIAKITALAVFMPVVAGQGGNAGAQTLAVVMRGLVLREIRPANARRLLVKELVVGTLNGLLIGLVTAGVAWLWNGNPFFGLVIGLAMITNLAAAGLAGGAIPLGLKACGMDPAQSSSIVLTTVTDIVGFLAFLGLAVLFQSHLLSS